MTPRHPARTAPTFALLLATVVAVAAPGAQGGKPAPLADHARRAPQTAAGWRGRFAHVRVDGTHAGQPAVRISPRVHRSRSFAAYRWPRPVSATTVGVTYRAEGWVKSIRPGRKLCLGVRELSQGKARGKSTRCVRSTGRWQQLTPVEYRARRSGSALSLSVSARRAGHASSYRLSSIDLRLADAPFVGRQCTLDCGAPIVVTGSAAGITSSAAALSGTLSPNASDTEYWFEFGSTSAYGSRTPTQPVGAGTDTITAAALLSGLHASTTYHYRLVAANKLGTTVGADFTF